MMVPLTAKRKVLCRLCSLAYVSFLALPALAVDPNYSKGVSYFGSKNFAQAAKCFELAMRANPADANALYYDAQCYDQLGESARATALYQHCVAIFPTSVVATYAQKVLNSRRPVSTQAAAKVENQPVASPVSDVSQDPIGDLLKKGNALEDQGNKAGAERCFLDALNLAEKNGSDNLKICDSLQALGDLNAEKSNLGRATGYYRRELSMRERLQGKTNPDLAKRMMKQAEVFQRDGDLTTAEDLYRRSADIYQSQYEKADQIGGRLATIRENLNESFIKLANLLRAEKRNQDATNVENQLRTYQAQN
jgi:tetratricopeptide (TPR) repeat protein